MITNAKVLQGGAHLTTAFTQAYAPGSKRFVMSPEHLAHFLPCPSKWQAGYTAQWAERHRWPALIATCFLTPDMWPIEYVARPDSFNDTALVCPKCETEGRSGVCRSCGSTRKTRTVQRAWAGSASVCKAWTAAQQAANRTILANTQYCAVVAAAANLHAYA